MDNAEVGDVFFDAQMKLINTTSVWAPTSFTGSHKCKKNLDVNRRIAQVKSLEMQAYSHKKNFCERLQSGMIHQNDGGVC